MFQKFKKYEGPVRERESLGTAALAEFAVPRMAHHPDFDMDIDHPDAQAIAHAPADIAWLVQECERLRQENDGLKAEREVAIATNRMVESALNQFNHGDRGHGERKKEADK